MPTLAHRLAPALPRRLLGACAALVIGALHSTAFANPACVTLKEPEAHQMFDAFNQALATQHPDKVARLFSTEALMIGLNAENPRSGYMDIRDYYVYFLTGQPQAHITQRQVHSGCNYVIDEGVLEWRFGADRSNKAAHYFMLHEYGPGGWRIAHYHDVAIDLPRSAVLARKTAVAGFLKRAPSSAVKAVKPAVDPDAYKAGTFVDGVPNFD